MPWRLPGQSSIQSWGIVARWKCTTREHGGLRTRASWLPKLAAGTIRSSWSFDSPPRDVRTSCDHEAQGLIDRLLDSDACCNHDSLGAIAIVCEPQVGLPGGQVFAVVAGPRDSQRLRHSAW